MIFGYIQNEPLFPINGPPQDAQSFLFTQLPSRGCLIRSMKRMTIRSSSDDPDIMAHCQTNLNIQNPLKVEETTISSANAHYFLGKNL